MENLSYNTEIELNRLGYYLVPTRSPRPDTCFKVFWNAPKHIIVTIVNSPVEAEDWITIAFDRLNNVSIDLREIEGFNLDEKGRAHFENDADIIPFVEALNRKYTRTIGF